MAERKYADGRLMEADLHTDRNGHRYLIVALLQGKRRYRTYFCFEPAPIDALLAMSIGQPLRAWFTGERRKGAVRKIRAVLRADQIEEFAKPII